MPPQNERTRLAAALMNAIKNLSRDKTGHNKSRYVAMRHFGLKGAKVRKIGEWIRNPSSISDAELGKIREVVALLSGAPAAPAAVELDHVRKVQRHAVSLLSSLKALVADVDPSTVADDTRMHVTNALEVIAGRFGIIVRFIDPAERKSRPATADDFSKAGQPKGRQR